MDNKYNKFCIYKIYQQSNPDIIYIGSTTDFNRRKSNHKKNCSNRVSKKYRYPLYQYIRACGGWENFTIEKVEDYPCKSRGEGVLREKELIKIYDAKLNVIFCNKLT